MKSTTKKYSEKEIELTDFLKITPEMIKVLHKLKNGDCGRNDCYECPFDEKNVKNGKNCLENGYASEGNNAGYSWTLEQKAKELLDLVDPTDPNEIPKWLK